MYGYGYAMTSAAQRGLRALSYSFDGELPAGFLVQRQTAAPRFTPAGALELMAPHTARISTRPYENDMGTGLLVEPASSNLLGKTMVQAADLSPSAATLANLSLSAFGLVPGVSIASTGADWNRALRNVTVSAGVSYAVRLWVRAGSSNAALLMFKSNASGKTSQIQGPVGALAGVNPQAGALTVVRQERLKDGQSWQVDALFVPTESASYSVGFGPFSAVAGQTLILLACQVEQAAASSSMLIDGAGGTVRGAETVTTPVPAGAWHVTARYADGSQEQLPNQLLAAGQWPALSGHHVAALRYAPA